MDRDARTGDGERDRVRNASPADLDVHHRARDAAQLADDDVQVDVPGRLILDLDDLVASHQADFPRGRVLQRSDDGWEVVDGVDLDTKTAESALERDAQRFLLVFVQVVAEAVKLAHDAVDFRELQLDRVYFLDVVPQDGRLHLDAVVVRLRDRAIEVIGGGVHVVEKLTAPDDDNGHEQ